MQAVQFEFSYPRYGLGLALGGLAPSLLWSGLSCTVLREVPDPDLPGPEWARIATRLGGICGTDLGTIHLKTSPYYSPYSAFPFTFGHENVGVIAETGSAVRGFVPGQRVIVEPTLWCAPRGFAQAEWCANCRQGQTNRCLNRRAGPLGRGMFIGANPRTGGSWSASFVAHRSQLYAVPETLSDEAALMVEPFACGLHAVLLDLPADDETILILGAGTIGLVTLAALRALGSRARVLVSARYAHQAAAAQHLGADVVLQGGDLYARVAEQTGAELLQPLLGKRVVEGGVDRVYECTGADGALDDANRLARRGGTVVLVGVPGLAKGVDWTAIFSQELRVLASTEYNHAEAYQGKTWKTYDLALQLMASGKAELGWLVNRTYSLGDYQQALGDLAQKGSQGILKAAFQF